MINVRDIGVDLDALSPLHQLHVFEPKLDEYQRLGFKLVEVGSSLFGAIIDGELREPQAGRAISFLKNFNLRYSVHGIERLNLAYDPRHELAVKIMQAQIEFCRRLGSRTLVYHSGLQALDDARRGVRNSLMTDEELAEGVRREVAAFRQLAPIAADAGVIIAMENADPHLWEYIVLDRFGVPRDQLIKHHQRLRIGPIVRQLEAINHPNVGLTLDVAHLHLAAHDLGDDYLASISQAAPWVRHLHVNDNFGRLDRGYDLEMDRWAFGEADIHLPPGWGSIPYREAFARLPDYEGDLILEIKPGFHDYLAESVETIRNYLKG